ncbi:hypothetical protein WG947_07410 [Pontibacter sp. H259]|uniref:dual OB domain-containing protein n=1 Tax=Pontibacter sp. H259 TaxID=3133421 RepID=UPI0030BD6F8A
MIKRFVCLANSFKEGGRCLAGVELDNDNKIVIENDQPKWIRPICKTPHGEVPTYLVAEIRILDIIEVDVTGYPADRGYQSENVYFREDHIVIKGAFKKEHLDSLCANRSLIFGNRGKAVNEDALDSLDYSLLFIKITEFEFYEKTYEDNPNEPQSRLLFDYKGNKYDLPITDPVALTNLRRNPDFYENKEELFLSLSLGVCYKGWCYKLVAGVLTSVNATVIVQPTFYSSDADNDLPF